MKQIGVFMTIPFVLAFPPMLGWWIGSWLDEKLDTHPYLMYVFIILGFIAGFRELYRIVKRFGDGA
jgi:ATP synthase protein I